MPASSAASAGSSTAAQCGSQPGWFQPKYTRAADSTP